MVDVVVHRHDMRPTLARLCRLLTKTNAVASVEAAAVEAVVPSLPDTAAAPSSAPA
jgi:acetyl-CoA carboxylase carboxyl transferase subunit beta